MMKKMRTLLLVTPLVLSACGDNYELIKTDTLFPYGNQRTAGSGVAYVVAQMMPERELNLKPVERPHAPEALEETKEILDVMDDSVTPEIDMDKVFDDAQRK